MVECKSQASFTARRLVGQIRTKESTVARSNQRTREQKATQVVALPPTMISSKHLKRRHHFSYTFSPNSSALDQRATDNNDEHYLEEVEFEEDEHENGDEEESGSGEEDERTSNVSIAIEADQIDGNGQDHGRGHRRSRSRGRFQAQQQQPTSYRQQQLGRLSLTGKLCNLASRGVNWFEKRMVAEE